MTSTPPFAAPATPLLPPLVPPVQGWSQRDRPWLASPWFLGLLLALAVIALYWNSLRGEWIFDDNIDILGRESVQKAWLLWKHFFQIVEGHVRVQSRPLVSLSFDLNFLLARNNPVLYHATNVAIHTLATLGLFGLLRRTLLLHPKAAPTPRAASLLAFTTALLWGVHPLQTEAVAYITQRYECLMGLFVFLTLLCVVRSAQSRRPHAWHAAAAFSCLLALASKEVAVSLPILVLLYDRAFLAGSFRGAWRARWFLYLALGATWVLFLLNQTLVGARGFAGFGLPVTVSWQHYALNQPTVILHYLRLVFWPHPLVLDYVWPPATAMLSLLPGFLVVGSLLAATLVALIRNARWGFLGAFFFLILAPTSSIMPILDLAVEHRMYLPLAPVLVGLVLGIHHLAQRLAAIRPVMAVPIRLSMLAGGALAVALLGSLTFLRSDDYRNSLSIWLDTVVKRPNNPRARANYAQALRRAGNLNEAIRQSQIALSMAPHLVAVRTNLGSYLAMNGQYGPAILELQYASRLDPRNPTPWVNLAMVYRNLRDLGKAEECLRTALALNPGWALAHFELGNVFQAKGNLEAALQAYGQAVRLQPGYSLPHWSAGIALLEGRRLPAALQKFDAYVRLEPDPVVALTSVGRTLYTHGSAPEGLRCWQQALQRDPKHLPALLLLSWALSTNPEFEVRQGRESLALAERALHAGKGRDPAILEALAAAYAELGRFPEACAATEEAIQTLTTARSPRLPDLQARLALYRNAQPYRENPSQPQS